MYKERRETIIIIIIIIIIKLKYVISFCTFTQFWHWFLHLFCLTLVPARCKFFGFGPSVKSQLKKTKLTVCHMDQSFHATW